jgi:hypothetical protein
MICPYCKEETDQEELDLFNGMCFGCMCDEEEKEFDAYYNQGQKCFNCGHELWHWKTETIDGVLRAVCWNCNKPGHPPIILTRKK